MFSIANQAVGVCNISNLGDVEKANSDLLQKLWFDEVIVLLQTLKTVSSAHLANLIYGVPNGPQLGHVTG